ncbi:MAG: hypothetical protein JWM31_2000, partial [Solirubrobacterales bacterium]|nr:hypothetical protein [Solirubrobacterales bacterium]
MRPRTRSLAAVLSLGGVLAGAAALPGAAD